MQSADAALLCDSCTYEDDNVRAWWLDGRTLLDGKGSTYIAVADGGVIVNDALLSSAMYACAVGRQIIAAAKGTRALAVRAKHYTGMSVLGGPVEKTGRLRYIDGCTDTGLIGPIRQGDPCLAHLHFPPGIVQTLHTHPSVRIGLVVRGGGLCRSPAGDFPLNTGSCFIIPAGAVHGFTSEAETMDIIAFHPDSLVGPTDELHQMLEATQPIEAGVFSPA